MITNMKSGKQVSKINTAEFARHLLNNPDIVYGFTTTLYDVHKNSIKTKCSWPYFHAMNIRMIDTQLIYINHSYGCGSIPFIFEIPSFNFNINIDDNKEQYEICLQEIVSGLLEFNIKYGELSDVWYITNNTGTIEITYCEQCKKQI